MGLPTAHHANNDNTSKEKDDNLGYIHEVAPATLADDNDEGRSPTDEELQTLRKVSAPMPWPAIAMCLIE